MTELHLTFTFNIYFYYTVEKSLREILPNNSHISSTFSAAISSPRNFKIYNEDLASRYKETQCIPRNMTDNIFLSRSAALHACERVQLAPRKKLRS